MSAHLPVPVPSPPLDHEPKGTRTSIYWRLIGAGFLGIAIYFGFFHRADDTASTKAARNSSKLQVAGWAELGLCLWLTSLEGTKHLLFSEDHSAAIYDENLNQANGTWSFDASTKRYPVTFEGETTAYSLFSPEDSTTCMLIKGSLDAADLRHSWFSFPDPDPPEHPDPPEYEP
jgi:hypothetical protein